MHDIIGPILQALAEMVGSGSPADRRRRLLLGCAIFLIVCLVAFIALTVWLR